MAKKNPILKIERIDEKDYHAYDMGSVSFEDPQLRSEVSSLISDAMVKNEFLAKTLFTAVGMFIAKTKGPEVAETFARTMLEYADAEKQAFTLFINPDNINPN
jgi:hypothetical protein